jgi:PAS domain S-box-containing protein
MRLALAVGIAYLLAAWLGLAPPTKPESVAVFWPAAGVAVGALIVLGRDARLPVSLGVMAATMTANLMASRSLGAGLAFALCNAGEALLTAWLIELWFGPDFRLEDVRSVLALALAAALGSAVAAAGGAAAMPVFGQSTASSLSVWGGWFAADALGIMTVAPLLIGLASFSRERLLRREVIEAAGVFVALLGWMGFESALPPEHWATTVPEDLVFPLVLWAAARCRPVFTAAAVFMIAIAAAASLSYGVGPLADPRIAPDERVYAAQAALLTVVLSALILAALFAERRRNEAVLRATAARLRSTLDAAKQAEVALHASNHLLDSIIENLPAMVFMKRASDLRFVRLNRAGEKLLGFARSEILNKTDYDLFSPERADFFTTIDRQVLAGEEAREISEERVQTRDGATRYLKTSKSALRDAKGTPIHLLGVSVDITEHKRAEEHIKLLMREITHRAKNLLAVVQVMARHTANEVDPSAFAERFGQRLAGLAASHDLLVKSDWRGVDIADLVRSQLVHLDDLVGTRVTVDGPLLKVSASAAQTIGMALHELATNAAKHGALSDDHGVVQIAWEKFAKGSAPHVRLTWSEHNGPPIRPPTRRGFGYTVMVGIVEQDLGADVRLSYAPSGVIWEMTAPASRVMEDEVRRAGAVQA